MAAGSLLVLPRAVLAQAYPSKPITLILPSVAGGILDTVGRIVARGLEKSSRGVSRRWGNPSSCRTFPAPAAA